MARDRPGPLRRGGVDVPPHGRRRRALLQLVRRLFTHRGAPVRVRHARERVLQRARGLQHGRRREPRGPPAQHQEDREPALLPATGQRRQRVHVGLPRRAPLPHEHLLRDVRRLLRPARGVQEGVPDGQRVHLGGVLHAERAERRAGPEAGAGRAPPRAGGPVAPVELACVSFGGSGAGRGATTRLWEGSRSRVARRAGRRRKWILPRRKASDEVWLEN